MIHNSGAGPPPIQHKELNIENLTEAIKIALKPATEAAAKQLSAKIKAEVRLLITINTLVFLIAAR